MHIIELFLHHKRLKQVGNFDRVAEGSTAPSSRIKWQQSTYLANAKDIFQIHPPVSGLNFSNNISAQVEVLGKLNITQHLKFLTIKL